MALTEVQKITLRDILTTAGLTTRQVEDVFLLLRFKSQPLQLAFYYRACGETQESIAHKIGVHQTTVKYYLDNCFYDVKKIMDKIT